jgi:hypothetical protein
MGDRRHHPRHREPDTTAAHEVDGVKLLITACGRAVFRQLDAAHWMSADSTKAGRRPCAAWR